MISQEGIILIQTTVVTNTKGEDVMSRDSLHSLSPKLVRERERERAEGKNKWTRRLNPSPLLINLFSFPLFLTRHHFLHSSSSFSIFCQRITARVSEREVCHHHHQATVEVSDFKKYKERGSNLQPGNDSFILLSV